MNAATMTNSPTITVGVIKSRDKGEIVLVYFNNAGSDPITLQYERLSRNDRHCIQDMAQDPLHILDRVKPDDRSVRHPVRRVKASHRPLVRK